MDLVRWDQLPDALRPGGDANPIATESGPGPCSEWTASTASSTRATLEERDPTIYLSGHEHRRYRLVERSENPVSVPDLERFEGRDWRDPFVFWNEAEQRYWMLLSARSAAHPAVSRGVVALQTSTDLITWSPAEELCETFLTHCPECHEVFQLGDKWVMGYSRFTDRRGTVYRRRQPPWSLAALWHRRPRWRQLVRGQIAHGQLR